MDDFYGRPYYYYNYMPMTAPVFAPTAFNPYANKQLQQVGVMPPVMQQQLQPQQMQPWQYNNTMAYYPNYFPLNYPFPYFIPQQQYFYDPYQAYNQKTLKTGMVPKKISSTNDSFERVKETIKTTSQEITNLSRKKKINFSPRIMNVTKPYQQQQQQQYLQMQQQNFMQHDDVSDESYDDDTLPPAQPLFPKLKNLAPKMLLQKVPVPSFKAYGQQRRRMKKR